MLGGEPDLQALARRVEARRETRSSSSFTVDVLSCARRSDGSGWMCSPSSWIWGSACDRQRHPHRCAGGFRDQPDTGRGARDRARDRGAAQGRGRHPVHRAARPADREHVARVGPRMGTDRPSARPCKAFLDAGVRLGAAARSLQFAPTILELLVGRIPALPRFLAAEVQFHQMLVRQYLEEEAEDRRDAQEAERLLAKQPPPRVIRRFAGLWERVKPLRDELRAELGRPSAPLRRRGPPAGRSAGDLVPRVAELGDLAARRWRAARAELSLRAEPALRPCALGARRAPARPDHPRVCQALGPAGGSGRGPAMDQAPGSARRRASAIGWA